MPQHERHQTDGHQRHPDVPVGEKQIEARKADDGDVCCDVDDGLQPVSSPGFTVPAQFASPLGAFQVSTPAKSLCDLSDIS